MARRKFMEGKVTGVGAILTKLEERSLGGRKTLRCTVGYRAKYATHVHEDPRPHLVGEWKYLETPARKFRSELGGIARANLLNKESLETSLRRAGQFLLEMSQELVPVDTGFLKRSGYVQVK